MDNSSYIINSNIAVSSRVRLARNIKNLPFPGRMQEGQGNEVSRKVWDSLAGSGDTIPDKFSYIDMSKINILDRQLLVEKHLISSELAEGRPESAAIISTGEDISILLNEEDHLRIQCIYPGMQLERAWKLCNRLDTLFEEKMDFAFDKNLGYLTCCPTNIGTGIRASVMLHLPALTMSGYIKNILEACGKLGMAIRGMFGENSEASGNMYQVSNQVTIGHTEEEIVASVNSIASQIIEQEKVLRIELYKKNPYSYEDMIYRSLGTLKSARILSSEEGLKLLSDVRLGVDMGIIGEVEMETLDKMLLNMQPAFIQKVTGRNLNPDERDIRRAEIVRNMLTMHKK